MTDPLMQVRDLSVAFQRQSESLTAVEGVSFDIYPGERVGLVGESGAGKSVTAMAMMGLLPSPPAQIGGQVLFGDTDLLSLPEQGKRRYRGRRVAMIFQDPLSCLSPRLTIGQQVVEALRAHHDVRRREARERAVELLSLAGIPAADRWAQEYPHRLSGGMAQRVMIAVALSGDPDVLIADEPTTALDVTIEEQIIDVLLRSCQERNTAVLFITHDLALEARFAQRLMVMYAGRVVEESPLDELFEAPSHPYTRGLLASAARADRATKGLLATIPGAPASATDGLTGCAFHPRCPHFEPLCAQERPALVTYGRDDRRCACHFAGRLPPSSFTAPDDAPVPARHSDGSSGERVR